MKWAVSLSAIYIYIYTIQQGSAKLFRTAQGLQPGIILRTGPHENECLARANLLRLVSHHGIVSVRDLGLVCSNEMLRPAGIMVVNGTRSVFLMSVLPVQHVSATISSPVVEHCRDITLSTVEQRLYKMLSDLVTLSVSFKIRGWILAF